MVNCPKCGFSQPRDRFCANCGVDMESFRPVAPPLMTTVLKNWVFQASIAIAAIILIFALVKSKNRSELLERLADVELSRSVRVTGKKIVPPQNAEEKMAASAPAAPPQNAAGDTAQSATAQGAASSAAAAVASATPQTQTSVSRLAEALAGDSSPPTKIKLIFAEVARPTLSELMNMSRSIASYGTYFSALLPDHDDRLKNVGTGTTLDSANDLQIKLNQPIITFKGTRDSTLDQNIGVTTQITPVQIDDAGVHLQVEVHRVVRAPQGSNPPVLDESFQEQFVLKKDSRAFMSGLLPHRVLTEDETRALASNSSILRVLATPEFQNNTSDFVLFIEAK